MRVFVVAALVLFATSARAEMLESSEHYAVAKRTAECSLLTMIMGRNAGEDANRRSLAAVRAWMAVVRKLGASEAQASGWQTAYAESLRTMANGPNGGERVYEESLACGRYFEEHADFYADVVSDTPIESHE